MTAFSQVKSGGLDSLPKIIVPDACLDFPVYAAFPQALSPGISPTTLGQRYNSSHVTFAQVKELRPRRGGDLFCVANRWLRLHGRPDPSCPVYFPCLCVPLPSFLPSLSLLLLNFQWILATHIPFKNHSVPDLTNSQSNSILPL